MYLMFISGHYNFFFGFQSIRNKTLEAILHTFDANTYLLHTKFLIHTQVCKHIPHLVPCLCLVLCLHKSSIHIWAGWLRSSQIVFVPRPDSRVPSSRCKHAACIQASTGDVFLYGGKNGHVALKDLWRYQPGREEYLASGINHS